MFNNYLSFSDLLTIKHDVDINSAISFDDIMYDYGYTEYVTDNLAVSDYIYPNYFEDNLSFSDLLKSKVILKSLSDGLSLTEYLTDFPIINKLDTLLSNDLKLITLIKELNSSTNLLDIIQIIHNIYIPETGIDYIKNFTDILAISDQLLDQGIINVSDSLSLSEVLNKIITYSISDNLDFQDVLLLNAIIKLENTLTLSDELLPDQNILSLIDTLSLSDLININTFKVNFMDNLLFSDTVDRIMFNDHDTLWLHDTSSKSITYKITR